MFHNYPYFTAKGEFTLIGQNIQVPSISDFEVPIQYILKAFQLINALRALHIPSSNNVLDQDVDIMLRNKAADLLSTASLNLPNSEFKAVLENRAASLRNLEDITVHYEYAQKLNLPLEVIIGSLPSWRYKKKPRTYSGLLALPDYSDAGYLNNLDQFARKKYQSVCEQLNIATTKADIKPSVQITCDVIALAGDFASHPIHIAHFLPEDEGYYDSPTYKTLVYRNLYISRYNHVSLPLAKHLLKEELVQPGDEGFLWSILSTWFRGHDLGHLYWDTYCKNLTLNDRRNRYALQEALADLFGFLTTVDYVNNLSNDDLKRDQGVSVYLSEMFRYMTRDITLFPDSKAAWFQFGCLIEKGVVYILPDKRIGVNLDKVPGALNEIMLELLQMVLRVESTAIESLIESVSSQNREIFQENAKLFSFKKEVAPSFSEADYISIKSYSDSTKTYRSKSDDDQYDFKRRF